MATEVVWQSTSTTNVTAVGLTGQKTNIGRSSGKWYFEIKWTSGDHPNIGICGEGSVNWLGDQLSMYSNGSTILRYYSGGSYVAMSPAFKLNDTIGVALDLDSNTIQFYVNGVKLEPVPVAYTPSTRSGSLRYPVVNRGSSSGSATFEANFGETPFNIVDSNPSEWIELSIQGFEPYDTLATWTIPITEAITISPTETYDEPIVIGGTLTNFKGGTVAYKILVNDELFLDWQSVNTEVQLNINILPNSLVAGKNKINVTYSNSTTNPIYSYKIFEVVALITELIQPTKVYANKIEIRWAPILVSTSEIQLAKLIRSTDENFYSDVQYIDVDLASQFHADTQILQNTTYYYRLLII